jgi:hypothetical protein
MQMQRRYWLGLMLGCGAVFGQGKGRGKGRGGKGRGGKGGGNVGNDGVAAFTAADRGAIWDYYRANPNWIAPPARSLPPGLAKNLQRGKPLPPGRQKKMVGFPGDLNGRLGPLPEGYRRVVVDRWAFVIANATNAILDVIDVIRN